MSASVGRVRPWCLLHGYGETGDMWEPLAEKLAKDHTVIVPDLRGMGLSARPAGGYDKKTQGHDIAGVLDALKVERADLVTHDIGNMVGYALAAEYPDRITRFVIIDAPLPGVGPWDEIVRSHALWHFSFYGPDAERLVSGREQIYLDRFWNEFSADPKNFDEASREHYAALYAQPGAMHAGFEQFKAFDQDAIDNKAFVANGKLAMPVLAVGGEKSFGPMMATVMRAAANNVTEAIVPELGALGDGREPDRDHQAHHGFSCRLGDALVQLSLREQAELAGVGKPWRRGQGCTRTYVASETDDRGKRREFAQGPRAIELSRFRCISSDFKTLQTGKVSPRPPSASNSAPPTRAAGVPVPNACSP